MAAAKAVRTSNNDGDDASTRRRNDANDANNDADAREDDADEDQDKVDGGGQLRATDQQIHRPTPLLCLNNVVVVFVVVIINDDDNVVHIARGRCRRCRRRWSL